VAIVQFRGGIAYNKSMVFQILYSPEAVDHLAALTKAEQVRAIDEIEQQLTHQPTLPTRRRKLLRPNPIAPWELRIGDIRVYYSVEEEPLPTVSVKAVGKKVHNELWIGGERVEL
jgi:mRNA-degrading endonuclease RelE of RelBE toxin-antitoxin system